ncbi:Phosphoethanolamine--lipid A transferase EptA N-terminal domain protein [Candidatus Hepatincolaceae symbiont of Richtersius coronifer]
MLISLIPYIIKPISIILLITNSIALYFMLTYNIILDKTMMGNVFNTNFSETSELFSFTVIIYIIFLGILPSFIIMKVKINSKISLLKRISMITIPLLIILSLGYANSKSWLWIDKNLKVLGSLSMPFSYPINLLRYKLPQVVKKNVAHPLPLATFVNEQKTIVILVIGESARAKNFSLYGYTRPTNPQLSEVDNLIVLPNSSSCATYITAALNCILSPLAASTTLSSKKQYEPLPTYLKKMVLR